MPTIFRSLLGLAVCLLLPTAFAIDTRAAEIPDYEWQQITPREQCWSARGMIGGSAVMNGRIWILGGGTYDPPTTRPRKFYNDVWSSADGIDWPRHTAEAPWFPRKSYDVPIWDNPLWVIEGYHEKGGKRSDVWDAPDGIQWTELSDTPWKPRHAASLVVHNGSLWMIAGNNMQPDVGRLTRKSR
ncbi:MAG: hypothetical protein DWI22_12985 [Planctomycetota bacterium]|nr:MAG: hypothetical protein DWI22_12985 [Planctomycetota bacterium]